MIRIRARWLQGAPSLESAALPRSRAVSRGGAKRIASSSMNPSPLAAATSTSTALLCLSSSSPPPRRSSGSRRRASSPLRVSAASCSSADREPEQQHRQPSDDDGGPAEARWRWDDSEDAAKAYTSLAAVLAAGAAASALDVPHASLPYFVGLVRRGNRRRINWEKKRKVETKRATCALFLSR